MQHNEFGNNQGLELLDYGARMYDARVGRWIGVDAHAENAFNLSPYCYAGNKPNSRVDLDGNDWWDIVNGIGTAIADNMYPGSNTAAKTPASNISDFNTGNKIGQVASMLIGATETLLGGGMMGTGGAGTVLSGGTASPVSVPLIAGGAAFTVQGTSIIAKGYANFMSGNGQKSATRNPDGAKGKSDHQQKVKDLAKKAESELQPGEHVLTERKIQNENSNRRPDVQIVNVNGKTRKIYEAERKPESKRNQQREAEYKRLDIPNQTHRVGGTL